MEISDILISYFTFNVFELVVLFVLFLLLVVQLFYYLNYYKKPYAAVRYFEQGGNRVETSTKKVSIIIVSENEVEALSENLPSILSQDYSDFEVIVVNNGSTDESDTLLRSLELKHPNLYHTYLPYSNDKMLGRYKLAMTIGVKAAKGNILLFTQPHCRPISNKWISTMVGQLSEDRSIVLGYSFYGKENHFYNRMARFSNHLFSMQYLSMALKGKPFMGIFRNVAFRKQMFFDNKGFASILHLEDAEEVLLNEIMTENNVCVSMDVDSFIETRLNSFSHWRQIKKSYSLSRKYIKNKAVLLFRLESVSRNLFYFLLLGILIYSGIAQHWGLLAISFLIFLIRYFVQLGVLSKSMKYFMSGKCLFSLPVLDFSEPFYNLRFKTRYRGKRKMR